MNLLALNSVGRSGEESSFSFQISGPSDERLEQDLKVNFTTLPSLKYPEEWRYLLDRVLSIPGVKSAEVLFTTGEAKLFLKTTPYIERIEVKVSDESLLSRQEIEEILLSRLPLPDHKEMVTNLVAEIEEVLLHKGLRRSRIVGDVIPLSDLRKTLVLHITPGDPLQVKKVSFKSSGEIPKDIPEPRLTGILGTPKVIEKELDQWIATLRERGYWTARYSYRCSEDEGKTFLECEVTLEPGPYIAFEFRGNEFFFTPDLYQAMDLDLHRSYTFRSLMEKAEAIRLYYVRNNFPFAEVTATVEPDPEGFHILYDVFEGKRRFIKEIVVKDIPSELEEGALEQLSFSPSLWERIFYRKLRFFDPRQLPEELEKIVDFLQERGYLDAKGIGWEIQEEDDTVKIVFDVSLGDPYVWSEVKVTGDPFSVPLSEELLPGSFVRPRLLRETAESIEKKAQREGYLDALVEARLDESEEKKILGTMSIHLGPRYRVVHTKLIGSRKISPISLAPYLELNPGDWADPEKLEQGRAHLLLTRGFEDVRARWIHKNSVLGWTSAEYQLRDATHGGAIEVGVVFATEEGIGADVRAFHRRLFGTLRSIALDSFVTYLPEDIMTHKWRATPLRSINNLVYEEPIPQSSRLKGVVQVGNKFDRTGIEYDWLNYILAIGLLYREENRVTYSLQYTYEWFRRFNVLLPEIELSGIDRLGGILLIADYSWLEPYLDPRKGTGIHQELLAVTPELGGNFRFLRYQISGLELIPFSTFLTFLARGRVGILVWKSSDPTPPRLKRFRLGGPQSLRGYQRDSVSPWMQTATKEAIALGGSRYVNAQTELQWGFTQNLALVVFQDGGWIEGFAQDILAWGYGGGILYHTPLGPIRLEMGWKGIPIPTDTRTQLLHFYFSTVF